MPPRARSRSPSRARTQSTALRKSTTPPSATAVNAYIEAAYLLSLGLFVTVAPRTAHAVMDAITFSAPLTPLGSELLWVRLFGALGVAYIGFWYAVAAYSNHTAFFRASVVTRCLVLPILHVSLVLSGCTNTAWLEAAVLQACT